jgi:hypothetical protein
MITARQLPHYPNDIVEFYNRLGDQFDAFVKISKEISKH